YNPGPPGIVCAHHGTLKKLLHPPKEIKQMKRHVLLLAVILLMSGTGAFAQEGAGAPPGTPTAPVPPGEEMKALTIAQLKLRNSNILQLVQLMPADKLGWNPGMTSYTPPPADYASHDYGRTFANLC